MLGCQNSTGASRQPLLWLYFYGGTQMQISTVAAERYLLHSMGTKENLLVQLGPRHWRKGKKQPAWFMKRRKQLWSWSPEENKEGGRDKEQHLNLSTPEGLNWFVMRAQKHSEMCSLQTQWWCLLLRCLLPKHLLLQWNIRTRRLALWFTKEVFGAWSKWAPGTTLVGSHHTGDQWPRLSLMVSLRLTKAPG